MMLSFLPVTFMCIILLSYHGYVISYNPFWVCFIIIPIFQMKIQRYREVKMIG